MGEGGNRKWQLLDTCETGLYIAMHDFTICKCAMLSVVRRPGRRSDQVA